MLHKLQQIQVPKQWNLNLLVNFGLTNVGQFSHFNLHLF